MSWKGDIFIDDQHLSQEESKIKVKEAKCV